MENTGFMEYKFPIVEYDLQRVDELTLTFNSYRFIHWPWMISRMETFQTTVKSLTESKS